MDDADSTALAGKALDQENMLDEKFVLAANSGVVDAMEFLLNKYAFLVRAAARRFCKDAGDLDGLINEGMISLADAVREYKRENGKRFRAYATGRVRRRIIFVANKLRRTREPDRATIVTRISERFRERSRAVVRQASDESQDDPREASGAADRDAKMISFLLHPPSPMDEFAAIVHGLPAAAWHVLERRGYSHDEISAVVGNTSETIRRKEARDERLDLTEGDRTMRLMRITLEAADAFGDENKALAWMRRPNTALVGKTPLEMIVTEAGTALVRRSLGVIAYGGVA